MRLFIAIQLPGEVRSHLASVQEAVKSRVEKASWTGVDNLHVTLKFLGEVADREFPALHESLSKIRIAGDLELAAHGTECFPRRGPVRVVSAALGGTLERVTALHEAIEQRCRHLGFQAESRTYRPHVTLARVRPVLPPATRDLVQQTTAALWPGPSFITSEFVLMQSQLSPKGSDYLKLATYRL